MAKHGRGKPLDAKRNREAFNPVASLPPVNVDFYRIAERERQTVNQGRGFMESKIAPIIETTGVGTSNGILLENPIDRFVADAEANHSYEDKRETNTLIVVKAITGLSAFVSARARAFPLPRRAQCRFRAKSPAEFAADGWVE